MIAVPARDRTRFPWTARRADVTIARPTEPGERTVTRRSLVAVSLVLVSVATARAHISAYSGALNPFLDDLSATRLARQTAATGGDAVAAKEIPILDAIATAIEGPAAAASYAAEMKAASDAATTLAKKLKTETALTNSLAAAAAPFRPDLDLARTDLAALVAALNGGAGAKAKKRLAKADKALKAAAAAASAQKPFYVQMKALASAAKLLSPSVHDPLLEVHGEPVSVAIDSTNKYVYVAEYGDTFNSGTFGGDVRQMSLLPDGSVSYLRPASVLAGLRPVGVVASSKAGFVYVGNQGEATISQYSVGPGGGLEPLTPPTVTLPLGTGVAGIAIDGNGGYVFTIAFGNGGSPVTSFKIGTDGTLTPVNTAYTSDFPTAIAASRVDPAKGGVVVTASRYRTFGIEPMISTFTVGADGSIATWNARSDFNAYYSIALSPGGAVSAVREDSNPAGTMVFDTFGLHDNGSLALMGGERTVGFAAYSIGLSVSGHTAYVGNWASDRISVFGNGVSVHAPAPYGFAASRDGKFLVVGNHNGQGNAANVVTVFRIGGPGGLTGP